MWKNSIKLFCGFALLAASLALVSCGTKKTLAEGGMSAVATTGAITDTEEGRLDFMRKVYDNEVYANCISSKIKFTISTGSKDMSVSGSLSMKKDEVIRIQLTPFGLLEVGRLEFTKDYVLLMDRMNKEYVKASYADVGFLQKNGLDFYTLQALFWNRLFIPGRQKITDSSLKQFDVAVNGTAKDATISLKRGDMSYRWSADKTSGLIQSVAATYGGKSLKGTSVTCDYGQFKTLGRKKFPTDITLTLNSQALKGGKGVSLGMSLGGIDTDGDWETYTAVSSKYKQVSVEDLMKRLLKL